MAKLTEAPGQKLPFRINGIWQKRTIGGTVFRSNQGGRPWYGGAFYLNHTNTNYKDDPEGRYQPPRIKSQTVVVKRGRTALAKEPTP